MPDLFTRSSLNPVLRPQPHSPWWKVYNPGATLDRDGRVHVFPRVMRKERDWHSRIAHAVSSDGERFAWSDEPVLTRRGADELRGLEDPRVTLIDDTYHMTFGAYDGRNVALHGAVSAQPAGPWRRLGAMVPDFDFAASGGRIVHWTRGVPVEATPTPGTRWSKSGALFPERIDGRYVLVFGEYCLWLATSTDGVRFDVETPPLIAARSGTRLFDNAFIEAGPPPLRTEGGWLLLYHGVDRQFRYQLGFVLLDLADPRRILHRSDEPVFGPRESYEVEEALIDVIDGGVNLMRKLSDVQLKQFFRKAREENIMPQVTFCPGAIRRGNDLCLYYGAGDTSVCTARTEMQNLLNLVP